MDTNGRIDDLGRQYIGAVPPNTTDFTPGVVSGGKGGQPGDSSSSGNSSPAISILPSVSSLLAAALFVFLLI
jgi:hypothetical protein